MNDRFKFRAINMKTKEIIYIDDYYWFEENGITEIDNNGTASGHTDEYWINQCTGLKDKNGKLIYEGDIVIEHYHNTKETAIKKVSFDKNVIGFAYTDGIEYNQLCITDSDRLQVIGNIYENKELLED